MEKPLLKKVTIQIPEALWLKAKRQALDERTNLRALVLEGLELRLAKKGRGRRAHDPLLADETQEQYRTYQKRMREITAAIQNTDWTEEKLREAYFGLEELRVASDALQRHFDQGGAHTQAERTRVVEEARAGFLARIQQFAKKGGKR